MGKISNELNLLREVQEIDSKLLELNKKRNTKKIEYDEVKDDFDSIKIDLETLEQKKQKTNLAIKQCELDISSSEKKTENSRNKMFSVKSQKEFEALKTEVGSSKTIIKEIEEEQLKLMEQLEAINLKLPEIKKQYDVADSKLEKINEELEILEQSIVKQQEPLTEKKNEVISKLSPRIKQIYMRILNNKGIPVLAPISETICSICNIDIPPQVVNEVRKEEKLFTCESCSRILIWLD